LLSVKEDIQKAQVDKIICLGDFIGYGPQPEEVAKYLMENEIPCVMGNHENAIINPADSHQFQFRRNDFYRDHKELNLE
jgi:predicted phosphodiesterase